VRVNLNFGTIGWLKNGELLYGMEMHERIMEKDIYPMMSMCDKEDCVEFL